MIILLHAGHFYGVWIPMEEEVCVPVSETYNRISDRSSSTRRLAIKLSS